MDGYLYKLTPLFHIKVRELHRILRQEGIYLVPSVGIRCCHSQGELFAEGRTQKDLLQRAQSLVDRGFERLGELTVSVVAKPEAPRKTKNAPGESWHQYGAAMDFDLFLGGKELSWIPQQHLNAEQRKAWDLFGAVVEYLGLVWGQQFRAFPEPQHIQLHALSTPLNRYRTQEASDTLMRGFGTL